MTRSLSVYSPLSSSSRSILQKHLGVSRYVSKNSCRVMRTPLKDPVWPISLSASMCGGSKSRDFQFSERPWTLEMRNVEIFGRGIFVFFKLSEEKLLGKVKEAHARGQESLCGFRNPLDSGTPCIWS